MYVFNKHNLGCNIQPHRKTYFWSRHCKLPIRYNWVQLKRLKRPAMKLLNSFWTLRHEIHAASDLTSYAVGCRWPYGRRWELYTQFQFRQSAHIGCDPASTALDPGLVRQWGKAVHALYAEQNHVHTLLVTRPRHRDFEAWWWVHQCSCFAWHQ